MERWDAVDVEEKKAMRTRAEHLMALSLMQADAENVVALRMLMQTSWMMSWTMSWTMSWKKYWPKSEGRRTLRAADAAGAQPRIVNIRATMLGAIEGVSKGYGTPWAPLLLDISFHFNLNQKPGRTKVTYGTTRVTPKQ